MTRLVGIAMMIDGVLQGMAVAAVFSTLADRYLSDQLLAAAHVIVGAALLFVGRKLVTGDETAAAGVDLHGRTSDVSVVGPNDGLKISSAAPLIAAFAIAAIETTWFNWIDLALRGFYTVVVLIIVLRKTTLPTT